MRTGGRPDPTKMATEAIVSDVGAIYKRLFHHRPVIQNEVHFFVREFEVKRGNSDLQSLQSCVSMVSEMETVYLEDIATTRPHFKAVRTISAKVSELGNEILSREKEEMGFSVAEQEGLDREVEQYRHQMEQETREMEIETESECERLGEEVRITRESRLRLRTVSVGSSAGLSLSLSEGTVDTPEQREGSGEEVEGEEGKEGKEGEEVPDEKTTDSDSLGCGEEEEAS